MTNTQISAVERYLAWLIASLFLARAVLPGQPPAVRFPFALLAALLLLLAADSFAYCIRLRTASS